MSSDTNDIHLRIDEDDYDLLSAALASAVSDKMKSSGEREATLATFDIWYQLRDDLPTMPFNAFVEDDHYEIDLELTDRQIQVHCRNALSNQLGHSAGFGEFEAVLSLVSLWLDFESAADESVDDATAYIREWFDCTDDDQTDDGIISDTLLNDPTNTSLTDDTETDDHDDLLENVRDRIPNDEEFEATNADTIGDGCGDLTDRDFGATDLLHASSYATDPDAPSAEARAGMCLVDTEYMETTHITAEPRTEADE